MDVLFFNEGNLGAHVMGQGQLVQALRAGLPSVPEVQARFAGLAPMGRLARALATRPVKPLERAGLDFRALRWHLVQSLRARTALRAELSAWAANVVHVHSQSVALALGGSVAGAPVALSVDATVREWWSMPAWSTDRGHHPATIAPSCALERRALERAPLTLAWTAWTRRSVESAAPGARVLEHHPGLDLEHYRPAARSERERPRVLFVGGRFAGKGGEDLLQALGPELGREVELDVVTPVEVPERPGVRVHRLDPSDPRLLDLQQQADLMCLPTYADAVPWAVLEAMACGTPVLSTRIGGIPDLLDDGRAGALVEHGDVGGLREALQALLGDPQARAQLAGRARERCEQRYDARRALPQMIDALREIARPALTRAPRVGA